MKTNNEVHSTKDYSIFKFYDKNREISKNRVQKLISSINKIDLTAQKPYYMR